MATNGYSAMEYGLRWREFAGRDGRLQVKEKWFKTAEQRARFADKVSNKDRFHEFVAWSDPVATIH